MFNHETQTPSEQERQIRCRTCPAPFPERSLDIPAIASAFDLLAASIREFGFVGVITVDEKNSIKYPVSAPFLDDVLYALTTFPELKEFDLIDSITQTSSGKRILPV